MEENLQLRQKTVKDILARHGESTDNVETNEFLLEEFQALLQSHGLPLYGEEVLTSIVLLENLVELTKEATLQETQEAMEAMIAALAGELEKKWKAKDKQFFIE